MMTAPKGRGARARRLSRAVERELERADAAWAPTFGRGSRLALGERYARALELGLPVAGESRDYFARWRKRVECEHCARYGPDGLFAEVQDERERDAAVSDDRALVRYEAKWAKRLAKLQRAHPARWRVPGLSDDELRDELTLRLIEAVRTKSDELDRHHRPGKEWGLSFLARERRALRQAFKIEVVLADLSPVVSRSPGEEESLIEQEGAALLGLARERAEKTLSRPQRRWLAAMKMAANAGAFFEASGKLNLSAVSRMLDKNRSSAQRAFGEISHHFIRELEKIDR